MTTTAQTLTIIFALVFLGLFCQQRKVFNAPQIEAFELFLFKIGLPCYLFTATLHYDLPSLLEWNFIYSYLTTFAAIALVAALYFWRSHSPPRLCVKILASGYVNSAIYTLPIITLLLKDPRSAIVANLIQVVLIQSCFITILGLLSQHGEAIPKRLFRSLSSPLVAMPIIGLLLNYFHFIPHTVITTFTKTLGDSASSLALFTFGLSLGGVKINKGAMTKEIYWIVFTKNLIHPLMAFVIGYYLFHLQGYWLYSLIITASAPTAFVIYLIAKQFSIDQSAVRLVVACSSISSLFSLALLIWAF